MGEPLGLDRGTPTAARAPECAVVCQTPTCSGGDDPCGSCCRCAGPCQLLDGDAYIPMAAETDASVCKVDDCPKPRRFNGMCYMHDSRVKRHGSPFMVKTGREPRHPVQNILRRCTDVDGCWVIRKTSSHGYGQVRIGDRFQLAHRVTYEHFIAEIPAGLQLDHLCRNKACCNPWHLEPVPHEVNVRRAVDQPVFDIPRGVAL